MLSHKKQGAQNVDITNNGSLRTRENFLENQLLSLVPLGTSMKHWFLYIDFEIFVIDTFRVYLNFLWWWCFPVSIINFLEISRASKQSLLRTIRVHYMILILALVSLSVVGVVLFPVMQFVYSFYWNSFDS